MCLLKEQNKELKRQLDRSDQGEQSQLGNHTHNQEKFATVRTQTQQASRQIERTHTGDDDDDPKGHPFTDEIMEA